MGTRIVCLRRFTGSDSPDELTELLHRAFSPLAAMGLNCTCVDQSVETTMRRIAVGECHAAFCDGRLVGTVTLEMPRHDAEVAWYCQPDVASLHQFAVEPAFQGTGLGTSMLEFAEDWACRRGCAELALHTPQPARQLVQFYANHGYRSVDSVHSHGKNYCSVVLSKTLGAPSRVRSPRFEGALCDRVGGAASMGPCA